MGVGQKGKQTEQDVPQATKGDDFVLEAIKRSRDEDTALRPCLAPCDWARVRLTGRPRPNSRRHSPLQPQARARPRSEKTTVRPGMPCVDNAVLTRDDEAFHRRPAAEACRQRPAGKRGLGGSALHQALPGSTHACHIHRDASAAWLSRTRLCPTRSDTSDKRWFEDECGPITVPNPLQLVQRWGALQGTMLFTAATALPCTKPLFNDHGRTPVSHNLRSEK